LFNPGAAPDFLGVLKMIHKFFAVAVIAAGAAAFVVTGAAVALALVAVGGVMLTLATIFD
jgi:hypothetical protein